MNFKSAFLNIGLLSFFCCSSQTELSKTEQELILKLDFDKEIVLELKKETKSKISQLPAIDSETSEELDKEYFDGIFSETSENNAINFVKKEKSKLKEKGYLVFYIEGQNGNKNIGIIKSNDELDILRYRKTDGINYDLENKDVIKKISEWKSKYGLIIIGCSLDYVHIEFDKLPQNMTEFAKEVYEFCPDYVDQGVGDLKSLEEYIKEEKGILLWWD